METISRGDIEWRFFLLGFFFFLCGFLWVDLEILCDIALSCLRVGIGSDLLPWSFVNNCGEGDISVLIFVLFCFVLEHIGQVLMLYVFLWGGGSFFRGCGVVSSHVKTRKGDC